jgi:hypothetical protein
MLTSSTNFCNILKIKTISVLFCLTIGGLLIGFHVFKKETGFRFIVNSHLVLKNNELNILAKNPRTNKYNMRIKIVANNTILYFSNVIKPGDFLNCVKVENQLSKGKYKGEAQISAMNRKTGECILNVVRNIKINVK